MAARRRDGDVHDAKIAFVVRGLDVFLGLNGLVRCLADDDDRVVALVLDPALVGHVAIALQGVDFRFWVAETHEAVQSRIHDLETRGYRVLVVDASNVEATYRRLCVSPRTMISGASLERDHDTEKRRVDEVLAKHPSYIIIEGDVPSDVIPRGIPRLRLTWERSITDVAGILDRAIHLHSAGGPMLVLADILRLQCARYCYAPTTAYNFPFRRVIIASDPTKAA